MEDPLGGVGGVGADGEELAAGEFAIRLTAYSSVKASADSARIAAVASPTPTVTRKVFMSSFGRTGLK